MTDQCHYLPAYTEKPFLHVSLSLFPQKLYFDIPFIVVKFMIHTIVYCVTNTYGFYEDEWIQVSGKSSIRHSKRTSRISY